MVKVCRFKSKELIKAVKRLRLCTPPVTVADALYRYWKWAMANGWTLENAYRHYTKIKNYEEENWVIVWKSNNPKGSCDVIESGRSWIEKIFRIR